MWQYKILFHRVTLVFRLVRNCEVNSVLNWYLRDADAKHLYRYSNVTMSRHTYRWSVSRRFLIAEISELCGQGCPWRWVRASSPHTSRKDTELARDWLQNSRDTRFCHTLHEARHWFPSDVTYLQPWMDVWVCGRTKHGWGYGQWTGCMDGFPRHGTLTSLLSYWAYEWADTFMKECMDFSEYGQMDCMEFSYLKNT
jgi:hypothetical protein